MSVQARFRFGFDIGGTFTDFVLCNMQTGELHTYKTLTTPDDPARAVIEGWNALLQEAGAEGKQVELSIHGTTLITNALIERRGARVAEVLVEDEHVWPERIARLGLRNELGISGNRPEDVRERRVAKQRLTDTAIGGSTRSEHQPGDS